MAAPKAAKVWIMTWGSRGDHEPAVALGKGLLARQHQVKVFGASREQRLFDAHAVPFGALDGEMLLHAGNVEARRKLEEFADAEGFTGPARAENYLLDGYILSYEFQARFAMKILTDGMPTEERAAAHMAMKKALDEFVIYGKDIDKLPQWRVEWSALLLEQTGRSAEVQRVRREAFARLVRRVALGLSRDPFDLLHTFQGVFGLRLMGMNAEIEKAGTQAQLPTVVREEVEAFFSWGGKEGEELEQYLDKYWEEWSAKLLSLDHGIGAGRSLDTAGISIVRTMSLTYEATPVEERPDIVIAQIAALPAGLHLRVKHGADVVPWWPQLPQRSLQDFQSMFFLFAAIEAVYEPPHPCKQYGSLPFLDLVQSDRALFSVSPLMQQQCDPSLKKVKACCTGQWVLDPGSSDGGKVDGFFGSTSEQEALEAFLAAAPEDPPVYFGWGSMTTGKFASAQAQADLVVRTLCLAGKRGVFVAGRSGVEQRHIDAALAAEYGGGAVAAEAAGSRLLLVKSASHSALFPRCACLVHHGGAGTCHSALRSGTPSVVTPLLVDQPMNADWVEALGCGLKAANMAELEADTLAVAVSEVLGDEGMRAKAKEVAELMAKERGVEAAIEIIERCLREPAPAYAPPEPSSCKDGVYDCFLGPGMKIGSHQVKGRHILSPDGKHIGMVRGGRFTIGEGESAATYNVQVSLPMLRVIVLGNVGEDGETVSMSDGSSWQWASELPQS